MVTGISTAKPFTISYFCKGVLGWFLELSRLKRKTSVWSEPQPVFFQCWLVKSENKDQVMWCFDVRECNALSQLSKWQGQELMTINIKSQIVKSLEHTPVGTGTHTTQEHTQVHFTCPKSFQNCDCLEQKINPNFKDSASFSVWQAT